MGREEKIMFFIDEIYTMKNDIYRISVSVLPGDAAAEDITQTVMEKAWKNLDSLKDTAKTAQWVKGILRNEIRNYLRGKKSKTKYQEANLTETISDETLRDAEKSILECMIDKEGRSYISKALELIDKKYGRIIKLHLIADLSLKDIAKIEGLKYGTARVMYSRGIKKLREMYFSLEKGEC